MKGKNAKNKKIDGLYIIENKERLLKKKKRNKTIKKAILIISLLIGTIITMALNLDMFNVKAVEVKGTNLLNENHVVELSKINIGENIFKLNCEEIESNVKGNKYVLNVSVKRSLPNKIIISVNEREAKYYEYVDRVFYIIDENGILLEQRQSIDGMNLIRVNGILVKSEESDEKKEEIESSKKKEDIDQSRDKNGEDENSEEASLERKGRVLKEVSGLIELNTSDVKITEVNVSDVSDIIVSLNNIQIYIGTMENLKKKLNIAVNIIKEKNLEEISGYIDISYHGNPVLYINP